MASKAGAAKVSLKIIFKDDIPRGGLHFTFTGSNNRENDRRTVQDTLIPFASANQAGTTAPVATTASAQPSPSAGPSGTASGPGTPGTPSAAAMGKRKAEGEIPAGEGVPSKAARSEQWSLRKRVLKKNPLLNTLYEELVLANQITDLEFWDGREVS